MAHIVIAGGGAAGFFGAIACAEALPNGRVTIFEKSARVLEKVRISGGGRCNVTHACFDPKELSQRYPRGARELISPFHRFQPRDTVEWFEARGIALKTEPDGRMFPVTDNSQTVIDCLVSSARAAGIEVRISCGVEAAARTEDGFALRLSTGEFVAADRLFLTTGGCRTAAQGGLAAALGHAIEDPAPSLFTFHVDARWVRELAGVSLKSVQASVPGTALREQGALLFTHWGLSGPAILRLSAWGAKTLQRLDYRFPAVIDWCPDTDESAVLAEFKKQSAAHGARQIRNAPLFGLPSRLWEALAGLANIPPEMRWSAFSGAARRLLAQQLKGTELPVSGKSLNKDEFVTCGGVRLAEVNFRTMESRLCPGLHFAGEILDIDGLTGGFNFQAAWTTAWIAGRALAASFL